MLLTRSLFSKCYCVCAHYALGADSKGSAHQVEHWPDGQAHSWGGIYSDGRKRQRNATSTRNNESLYCSYRFLLNKGAFECICVNVTTMLKSWGKEIRGTTDSIGCFPDVFCIPVILIPAWSIMLIPVSSEVWCQSSDTTSLLNWARRSSKV